MESKRKQSMVFCQPKVTQPGNSVGWNALSEKHEIVIALWYLHRVWGKMLKVEKWTKEFPNDFCQRRTHTENPLSSAENNKRFAVHWTRTIVNYINPLNNMWTFKNGKITVSLYNAICVLALFKKRFVVRCKPERLVPTAERKLR